MPTTTFFFSPAGATAIASCGGEDCRNAAEHVTSGGVWLCETCARDGDELFDSTCAYCENYLAVHFVDLDTRMYCGSLCEARDSRDLKGW